jgi:cytoskeletal protein RodZ
MQAPVAGNGIKETRLGSPVSAAHSGNYEVKETRLGESFDNSSFGSMLREPSPSFFSNLTWMHYAGAGGGALVVLALLIIVPVFMFSGSNELPNNTPEIKSVANTSIENKEEKAKVISTPTPAPVIRQAPVASENPSAVISTPIETPTYEPLPVDRTTSTSKTVERTKSPPQQQQPPPTTKKRKLSREEEIERARCKLTGRC